MGGAVYSVSADGFNTFVGENTHVKILAGGSIVEKLGRDLQEGDLFVVKRNSVNISREQVFNGLEDSLRYRMARETFSETNSDGRHITKLRTLLLMGLAGLPPGSLDDRVMLQGADFSQDDYSVFAGNLELFVERSRDTVMEWLHGKTKSPKNWNDLAALVRINPAFQQLYESYGQPYGFHAATQLYWKIRTVVRSKLKTGHFKFNGDSNGNGNGKDACDDEVQMVLNKYVRFIDEETIAIRIRSIKEVQRQAKAAVPEIPIAEGVYQGDLPAIQSISMARIRDYVYVLTNAMIGAAHDYVSVKLASIPNHLDRIILGEILPLYIINKLARATPVERYGLAFNMQNTAHAIGASKRDITAIVEVAYKSFLDDLQVGNVDMVLRTGPNTFANLIDRLNDYRVALPKTFYEWERLDLESKECDYLIKGLADEKEAEQFLQGQRALNNPLINGADSIRKARREIENKKGKSERKKETAGNYLIMTYGLNPAGKLLLRTFYVCGDVNLRVTGMPDRSRIAESRDPAVLRETRILQEAYHKRAFYRKEEIAEIFDALKLPGAVRLIDNLNFV